MGSYSESEKASQHREMPSNAVAALLLSGRNRQRRFPGTTLMMHGAPALVLAQHLGRNLRFKGSPLCDRPRSNSCRHQCRSRQAPSEWITSRGHVFGDGRLRHRKAELEELTMNARRTPKPVVKAHPPDQRPQICSDLRPASQVPRFPAPIAPKTSTMPAHEGLGPDDHHGLEHRWKPTIQLDEKQAIAVRELDATAQLALEDDQLMPEHGIFCFKSGF